MDRQERPIPDRREAVAPSSLSPSQFAELLSTRLSSIAISQKNPVDSEDADNLTVERPKASVDLLPSIQQQDRSTQTVSFSSPPTISDHAFIQRTDMAMHDFTEAINSLVDSNQIKRHDAQVIVDTLTACVRRNLQATDVEAVPVHVMHDH